MRTRRLTAALAVLAVVATSAPLAVAAAADGRAPAGARSAEPAAAPAAGPAAAPAADPLPNRVLGKEYSVLPIRRKAVALTIDCGANATGIRKILATLDDTGVPATFFVTGSWVDSYPGKTKALARRGFPIGNHTRTHPRVPSLSDSRLRAELTYTAEAVERTAGVDVKPWFRFPYGARRLPYDVKRVNDLGYIPFLWTVDTIGWMGTSGGQSVGSVTRRVLNAARPGEIVLMHCGSNPSDGSTLDADALPGIIDGLRDKGYGFTTVEALLDPSGAPYVD